MTMRARRGGFTLLEVVATLVIVAVAAAVAAPAFRSLLVEDDVTVATHRIEALFRLARDSSIRTGQPVTVVVDSVSGLVWLDAPPFAGVADSLRDAQDERRSPFERRMQASSRMRSRFAEAEAAGTSLDLPAGIRIALTRARARFAFVPTGAAFTDTLWLRTSVVTRGITVDPWTGDAIIF
jgi:prepilin-type N-terminal cleavage/methylation domain-containing protein